MTSGAFGWYATEFLEPGGITAVAVAGPDNAGYAADIDGQNWRIRTARVTPTKPGAFVSVWRRAADGSTEPFPASDPSHGLLVFVDAGGRRGVFVFSAAHLVELGVTRSAECPGKRGFRVYPQWCGDLNPVARRTQRAQAKAFDELAPRPSRVDIAAAARRFHPL